MFKTLTIEDKIKQRIEILQDEKQTLEELIQYLNMENEDDLRIILLESSQIQKAEIIIEEYQKLLNDTLFLNK